MACRPALRALLLVAPVAVAIAAGTVQANAEPTDRHRPLQPRAATEQIYLADCAVCHGAAGEGSERGPSIRDSGPALVDYYLSTGRMPIGDPDETIERAAPAYRPEQVRALVDYVVDLGGRSGRPIPEVDPDDGILSLGGELFRLNCAACHAWGGEGGILLEEEVPPLGPATPVQAAEAIRVGPGSMPVYGEASFDEVELASIVAYVEYLDEPEDPGGEPLGHVGPVSEGAVAWIVGMGLLMLSIRWIGKRRGEEGG